MAAAHAACYAMALNGTLGRKQASADRTVVRATVTADRSDAGIKITACPTRRYRVRHQLPIHRELAAAPAAAKPRRHAKHPWSVMARSFERPLVTATNVIAATVLAPVVERM